MVGKVAVGEQASVGNPPAGGHELVLVMAEGLRHRPAEEHQANENAEAK